MHRYLLPRLQDFFFVLMLAGTLFSGSRMLNADSDLGRHLTLGHYILATHEVPTHDVLSFTKSEESRPPYEWLAQVLLALAYQLLGLDGVALLTSLVLAAAFTVVYTDAVERSNAPILALFLAGWAAAASSLHWVSRPHVFSFLFLAIWLSMLDKLRRDEKVALWQFPALMLIWVNTHGGFILGFLACAAYLAGWLLDFLRKSGNWLFGKRLLIVGGTSLVASILTPDLWNSWIAVLNNRSSYVLSRTVETMPLQVSLPNVWPFLALLALSILLMLLRQMQIASSHAFLLTGLAIMGFAMTRNIPFFGIAAAPICMQWLVQSFGNLRYWLKLEEGFAKIDRLLYGFVWSLLAIVYAFGFLGYFRSRAQTSIFHLSSQVFPIAAVDWLDTHPPQGNMFNDFNWGGYLLFRLWPEQRVFIDSQSDFYGEQFIRQYVAILGGEGDWEAELSRYRVNWIIVPTGAGLAEQARLSPNWRVEYEDEVSVVLVRKIVSMAWSNGRLHDKQRAISSVIRRTGLYSLSCNPRGML